MRPTAFSRCGVAALIILIVFVIAIWAAIIHAVAAQTLEASNGALYHIVRVATIDNRWRGGSHPYAMATVVTEDREVINITFSCDGQYSVSPGPWLHVPSRSVVAEIGRIACRSIS